MTDTFSRDDTSAAEANSGLATESNTDANTAPPFTVVAGKPTPSELAAVTAVLTAMVEESTNEAPRRSAVASEWSKSARSGRSQLTPGPGSWNRQSR